MTRGTRAVVRRALAGATAVAVSTTVLVVGAAGSRAAVPTLTSAGAPYVSVHHTRVLDAGVKARTSATVKIEGMPAAGVSGVVLSVAVASAAATGALIAFPYGTKRPGVVSVSLAAGHSAAGLVVVAVNNTARLSLYNGSGKSEKVVATVVGYYAAPGTLPAAGARTGFVPVTPQRLGSLSDPAERSASFGFPTPRGVTVAGVVLDLTVAWPTRPGTAVIYPSGTKPPRPASIGFVAGRSSTQLVVVAPGSNRRITVANRSTHAVRVWVDVVGYLRTLTVPTAPGTVTGSALNGGASVSWTQPASDGGTPITSYRVVASPGAITQVVTATTATFGGLQDGTGYTFTVTAVNGRGAGPASAATAPVIPYTVPGAPTLPVASASGLGQVTVSWIAPAADGGAPVTGYRVTALPGGTTVTSTTTAAVLTGLTAGQIYTFTVVATNAAGASAPSAPSNPATAEGTSLVSVNTAGVEGDQDSEPVSGISSDGRYVAFGSDADNLAPHDSNGDTDVFVRDRLDDTTTLVSVNAAGTGSGNGDSNDPAISADGRYVVFDSAATDLVSPPSVGDQVFVRDLQSGTTTLVSATPTGVQANHPADQASISADGSTVTFRSTASNLDPNTTNGRDQVYVVTLATHAVQVASDGAGSVEGNGDSGVPVLSADGRLATFESNATNLVATTIPTSSYQVYLHDMVSDVTTIVSVVAGTASDSNGSFSPSISGDGRYVAFESKADNVVSGETNGLLDIFVADTTTGLIRLVSGGTGVAESNGDSDLASLSGDGRFVAFDSLATNLVPGDTNAKEDVFVFDTETGLTRRISVSSAGSQADNLSTTPYLSEDGQHLLFASSATNLVAGDTNAAPDEFVADLG